MDETAEKVLAAFREVTGWTDAEVLHYAVCDSYCNPICGAEEDACPEGRAAAPQQWPTGGGS